MLKETAVDDCLSSVTAGLNESSIRKIKKSKLEQFVVSQLRASSGASKLLPINLFTKTKVFRALQLEDVGISIRLRGIRSA